ncbi:MAG: DUF2029 domain-containing protein [Ktedonobacterales bacterium]|nr:DUF2029 domain-containing protein [Ktedonobacterales bacterium]
MMRPPLDPHQHPLAPASLTDRTTLILAITPQRSRTEWWWVGGLLLVGLLIRLHYAPNGGFFYDLKAYTDWGRTLDAHFFTPYSAFSTMNYPPLAIYLCAFGVTAVSIINPLLHLAVPTNVLISGELAIFEKIPVLICDIVLIASLFWMARHYLSFWWSFALAAAYAFSPAVILVGSDWGQMDGVFALCLVFAFWFAIHHKAGWAGVMFGLALMLKPQPVVLTPVFLVYMWHDGWRALGRTVGAIAATCTVICLPYLIPPNFEILVMLRNIVNSLSPNTSSYAYNMWWGLGLAFKKAAKPVVGPFSATLVGWFIFALVVIVICLLIWRVPNPVTFLVGAALVMYAFFDFTTGQHERYLFPALPLFLLAAIWQRRYLIWYSLATAMSFGNMMSIIIRRYRPKSILNVYPLQHFWILQSISWLNVIFFGVALGLLLHTYWPDIWGKRSPAQGSVDLADAETLHMRALRPVNPATS